VRKSRHLIVKHPNGQLFAFGGPWEHHNIGFEKWVFGDAIRRIFLIEDEYRRHERKTKVRSVPITAELPAEDVRRKWLLYQSAHNFPHVRFRGGNDAEGSLEAWFAAFYDENANDCNNNVATCKLAVISIRLGELNVPKIVTLADDISITAPHIPFHFITHLISHAQGGKRLYSFNIRQQPDTIYFLCHPCDRRPSNVKSLKSMCESVVLKSALEKQLYDEESSTNFIKIAPEYLQKVFFRLNNFVWFNSKKKRLLR